MDNWAPIDEVTERKESGAGGVETDHLEELLKSPETPVDISDDAIVPEPISPRGVE